MIFLNFRWRPFWKWRPSWIFLNMRSDRLIMVYLCTKFQSSSYFIVFIMIFLNFRWRPFWKWRPFWFFFYSIALPLMMVYFSNFVNFSYFKRFFKKWCGQVTVEKKKKKKNNKNNNNKKLGKNNISPNLRVRGYNKKRGKNNISPNLCVRGYNKKIR